MNATRALKREGKRALVVDDESAMCAVIARLLQREGFDVTQAGSVGEAQTLLGSGSEFKLVVCDLNLPDGSGLDFVREVRQETPATATIIASGEGTRDTASTALAEDVDEYLFKPFGAEQLAVAVAAALRRRSESDGVHGLVDETKALIAGGTGGDTPLAEQMLERLARAGRFRDEETSEHVERMSRTCALIGTELGLEPDESRELRAAAAMHDLGKLGVPDAVLRKPGKLTEAERKVIEGHPEIGHEILAGSGDPTMDLAATIALTHHERVDGKGYPRGLVGDAIPLPGRIAAVADVFDALTHDRVYRPAFSIPEALDMLREGRGSQFDERVLDAFELALPGVVEVRRRYPDAVDQASGTECDDRPPRILLVDDHDALARGVEVLLRRAGFEIAGSARNLDEARALLDRRQVDVAVVDIALAHESGLDLVADVKAKGSKVLLYSGLVDAETMRMARDVGADGFAAKAGSPGELAEAIRTIAAGSSYFDKRAEAPAVKPKPEGVLTPREREVTTLLAEGLTGEAIAEQLFLSPETVRTHVRNAMDRTGAKTRAHLIAIAGPEIGLR